MTVKYLDGETISDVDADVYEITVRITQELKTAGVPDLSKIRCHRSKLPNEERYYSNGQEFIVVSLSYEDAHLDISLKDAEVIGADSISNQPSGWYFYYLDLDYVPFLSITMYYGNNELYGVLISPFINDQYLVIDGQLIHFRDGYGPIHSYMTEEDTTLDDGTPAKAFITYYEITYLGKKLSGTGIVTDYQLK